MSRPPRVDPAVRAQTRRSLHGVAELLLAGPQYRHSHSIELRALPGGFGTLRPPQARVEGVDLVVGERRTPLDGRTYAEVAADVGLTPSGLDDVYSDGCGVTPEERIVLDPEATAEIAIAFADGEQALRRLAPDRRPVLWPEHFDLAIDLDRVNYGVSAGDADIDQPYAYVGPWDADARVGDFWNTSFGAARTVLELGGPEEILAFFRDGRSRASRG